MNDDRDGYQEPTSREPEWQDGPDQTQPLWQAPGTDPPIPGDYAPRNGATARHRFGVGMAALLVAVGALAGAGVAQLARDRLHVTVEGGTGGSGTTSDSSVAAIARTVSPAVVDINVTIGYQQAEAAGTGMVLTSDGEVLTNNHVIDGATRISVTDVGNGRTYPATVTGYDRSHDVAVLHLTGASGLSSVTIGDSSTVRVGAAVVAIGNGGGTGGLPSSAGGTVTALDREITASDDSNGTSRTYTGLIETDANIVPGYSGGPLVDTRGRVIGINTAASGNVHFRFSSTEGFAIPINTAMQIARRIQSGTSSATVHIGATAMLGVSIRTSQYGSGDHLSGVLIAGVLAGGPADRAGLSEGDVIVSVAGRPITSADTLTDVMTRQRPGASVSVGYISADGQQLTTTVRLDSGPPQ